MIKIMKSVLSGFIHRIHDVMDPMWKYIGETGRGQTARRFFWPLYMFKRRVQVSIYKKTKIILRRHIQIAGTP